MSRLAGKVALITGASKGLGEADARLFVAEGATVIIADVDEAAGSALAAELGEKARFARLDVRSEEEWRSVAEAIERDHGRLDVLVNNAGVVEVGTPEDLDMDVYRFVLAVSLDGTVLGCKYCLPLLARSNGGSIVNMSSITAVQGHPRVAAYSAAKGAVDAYSRCVAVYCAQTGKNVRCNAILPDQIDTPMVRSMGGKAAGTDQRLTASAPDQGDSRHGHPNDIAYLVVYLASDEARFVSGQSFVVDNTSSITKGYVPPRVPA